MNDIILQILADRNCYDYYLHKLLEIELKELYTIMSKLETEGLVKSEDMDRYIAGVIKCVRLYMITEKGRNVYNKNRS